MCRPFPSDPWNEELSDGLEALSCARDSEGLERISRQSPSPVLRALARMALDGMAAELAEEGGPLSGLASPDLAVRTGCARSLAQTADRAHLPALKRRFASEDVPVVRALLLEAIASRGGPDHWPFVAAAWRDPDRLVRARVIDLAARFATGQDLINLALLGLKDPDREIRDRGVGLLAIASSRSGSGPRSADLGLDEREKIALARRLRQEPDPELVPLLRRLVAAVEPGPVVDEALRSLTFIGGADESDTVRVCLARSEPRIVARTLLCLTQLEDHKETDLAAELSAEPNPPEVRAAAMVYLLAAGRQVHPKDALAPLMDHATRNLELLRDGRTWEMTLCEDGDPQSPPGFVDRLLRWVAPGGQ